MIKLFLIILTFIGTFILVHKSKIKNKNMLKLILVILGLEVVVFNFNSFRMVFGKYEQIKYTVENCSFSDLEYNSETNTYKTKGENPYIEIKGINKQVATIKLDVEILEQEDVDYTILYTDATSKNYRKLPTKTLVNNLERSQYVTCYLAGETDKIAIVFFAEEDLEFKINKIEVNKEVPFNFNVFRFSVLSGIAILVYMIVKSSIFKMPYDEKILKQNVIIIAIVLVFCIALMWCSATSKKEDKIYYRLVDSIIAGQISLITDAPEELELLDNPYDATQRSGISYLWDVAYYDGSYYVYFGILPALLFYIPIKLLTGITLKLNTGILIFTILTTINLARVLMLIFKKWFSKLEFKYLILAIIGTIAGSLLFWVNRRPMVYELVLTGGICFVVEGTYLMLKALYLEEKVNYKDLTLGALCLALAVACRPNHLLISLVFVPKLLKILIKNIEEKKNVLKFVCSVGIPYLIVGILLMIYNYIRFDSIFEFGTSYQLTVNDMRNLPYRLLTIPVGIITQLFKLPVTTNEFPFFVHQHSTIPFFGYYYVESLVSGLIVLNPINLILLLLIKLKKKIKEKEAYNFTCILTIVAIIICIVNIALAGTLQRYSMDYAWILNIASYLTLFIIASNIKSEEIKKYILIFAIIITLYMLISNFIVGAVVSEENLLEKICPTQYYGIRYGICFWE